MNSATTSTDSSPSTTTSYTERHSKRLDFLESILLESTPAQRKVAFVIPTELYNLLSDLTYATAPLKQFDIPFSTSNEELVLNLKYLTALRHKTRYFKALQLNVNTMQPSLDRPVFCHDSRERRAIRLLLAATTTAIKNRLTLAQQEVAILQTAML